MPQSTRQIHFLPHPRRITPKSGVFDLKADTSIILRAPAVHAALQTAFDLKKFMEDATHLSLPIVGVLDGANEKNAIVIELAPSDSGKASPESYTLEISPSRIKLRSPALAGLRWAERTFRQVVAQAGRRIPTMTIEDEPLLPFRGVMLDVSRGKVPTLDTLCGIVEQLSYYKFNVFQLYIEHTFAFRRHPLVGAGCGALTSEDILRLDEHCRRHGVELIPSLQSFGHMHHMLKLPPYQHLAETERRWTITPSLEESYELLEEMFADFLPSFTSSFFNINCDETYDLGMGKSKAEADRIGVGRLYLNHILRLHRIVTGQFGKRMMMWGDIILNHPELVAELPNDIIVLNWGYEADHLFTSTRTFAESGLTHWVCPGTSTWNTVFPRVNVASANISGFAHFGIRNGCSGLLVTDWGDGGHYNLQGLSWHAYLCAAERAWSGDAREEEDVDSAFGRLFFGKDGEKIVRAIRELGTLADGPETHLRNKSRTMFMLFSHPGASQDAATEDPLAPLTPALLRRIERKATSASRIFASALEKTKTHQTTLGSESAQTLRELQLAADLLSFAARKTLILKRLGGDSVAEKLSAADAAASRRLIADQRKLVSRFKKLWLARSSKEGIEQALGRFAEAERYLAHLVKGRHA